MIKSIAAAVELFDRRHPRLRTPLGADGMCCWASGAFCRAVPGARMLHLLGSRRHFPLRLDDYPAKDPEYYHVVVKIGDVAIDWTRRQLDPSCQHPFVQPLFELRREWIRIGPSPEYLGL